MPSEGALRDRRQADYRLIETLRWEPESGFVRLDRHLARLARSAAALGFAFRGDAEARLAAAAQGDSPLRIRLTLSADGAIEVTAQPFILQPPGTVWRLAIAGRRLDETDPFVRHKTTRRAIYDEARAEFPRDEIDEVIVLNCRGEVSEGTITSVFVEAADDCLLTPPLHCGLLPGILREELIETGRAEEAVITADGFARARTVYLGNSLRGLIRAKLVWPPKPSGFRSDLTP